MTARSVVLILSMIVGMMGTTFAMAVFTFARMQTITGAFGIMNVGIPIQMSANLKTLVNAYSTKQHSQKDG
jgi:hypothetical protein